ncbi:MAG: nucleotidyltransferase domain-containing protein [Candidatus Aenigmatarchaeota archaeon]
MLQNCTTMLVANVFFREPMAMHYLREISKKAGIAHTSVKRELESLKSAGIIEERVDKKGERIFPIFFANIGDGRYLKYKKLSNIINLIESGLLEYLKDEIMPSAIILFGSYLRGEDTEDSDIDLFVSSKKQKITLSKFEKLLGRNIQLHFNDEFDKSTRELKNNILNGMMISGYLEVYK